MKDDTISRRAAIDAVHKAGITKYDETLAIEEIGRVPSAQPVDEAYLVDWYINSVDDSEPVWTEAHIKELMNDFYLIPKGVLKDG